MLTYCKNGELYCINHITGEEMTVAAFEASFGK